jgi:hypothetical protein
MAFGENLRILPVLGLALAGGLAIGLVSAFAQNHDPVARGAAAQGVAGPDLATPNPADIHPVKFVVRQHGPAPQAERRQRDPVIAYSNPARSVRRHAVSDDVYYSGCREVRAAGAAPLYRGEPGYRPEMDGDSDGIACEPYRGMR